MRDKNYKRPEIAGKILWDDSELKNEEKIKDVCKAIEVYIQDNQYYKDCILNGNYAIRFSQAYEYIQHLLAYQPQQQEKKEESFDMDELKERDRLLIKYPIHLPSDVQGYDAVLALIKEVKEKGNPENKIDININSWLMGINWCKDFIKGDLDISTSQSKERKTPLEEITEKDINIAWKSLEWVGFTRNEEFNDNDVKEMLSKSK